MDWLLVYILVAGSVTLLSYALMSEKANYQTTDTLEAFTDIFVALLIGIAWPVTVFAAAISFGIIKLLERKNN